jgi:hypothetical protein
VKASVLWVLGLVALGNSSALASDAAPTSPTHFHPGWNRIVTGAQTGCIDGGEYAFYVRSGDPKKLTIMFMGGGPCWNGISCDTCGTEGDRHRI